MIERLRSITERFFPRPLPPAGALEPPGESVLRRVGFDAQTLRRRNILPQYSAIAPAGYALVVAHPDALAVREFEAAGVQVLFADAREIERAWEARDLAAVKARTELGISADVERVLCQIVKDCAALGAEEVFLGHPSDCGYEGIAEAKRFSGFVHQRVFAECLAAVRRLGQFSLESSPPCRAALTRNFDRPIVCLTWTIPRQLANEPEPPVRMLAEIAPPSQSVAAEPGATKAPSPARILLIEDDDRFASVLTQILRARGFDVLRAPNGAHALDHFSLEKDRPDLVISDVHMPVCDGRSFVSALRDRHEPVPILMLTSDDCTLLEANLVLLGANAYVRKSDDPRVLLAWIQNLLCTGGRE